LDPEFEKGGAQIENKVTPIALCGSNPGDGIVDNLCSYFSEHEATNKHNVILLKELGEKGGRGRAPVQPV
jgi:hypothetical protein